MTLPKELNLDTLSLVFATQRSGSTALCQAIKQTGLFGRPKEIFLDKTLDSRADVFSLLKAAEFPKDSKTSGAKIMLSQVGKVATALRGTDFCQNTIGAVNAVIDDLSNQCKVVAFGIVREDPVDIAVSLGFAKLSGVWHMNEAQTKNWSESEIVKVAMKAQQATPRIKKEIAMLKDIQKEIPQIIWFDYDYCLTQNFDVARDILARAEQNDPQSDKAYLSEVTLPAQQKLKKIVTPQDHARVLLAMKQLSK